MKIKYPNEFVQKLGVGDPTTFFYQFIYDEKESVETEIIQYFIMHVLVLCIKVDSYVAHMFYAWSFGNNTEVPIAIKKNKYFISFNTHTTIFYWGAGNYNKIKRNNYIH